MVGRLRKSMVAGLEGGRIFQIGEICVVQMLIIKMHFKKRGGEWLGGDMKGTKGGNG